MSRRIAIIGAGMAGLTCAQRLNSAHQVTLFEKARGPGGRLSARRVELKGQTTTVDLGAQYFTIREAGFQQFLQSYTEAGAISRWTPSLLHWQEDTGWTPYHEAERFVGTPRMSALSRALAEGLDICSQTRIQRLQRRHTEGVECWWLLDSDDTEFGPFDQVVLTMPVAQCRTLLDDSQLSHLIHAFDLDAYTLLPAWATAVALSNPLPIAFDGFQMATGTLQWCARNSSKPGRTADVEWWVLHAHPDWSQLHIEADAEFVKAEMIRAFEHLITRLPETPVLTRPEVTASVVHRWRYAQVPPQPRSGFCWHEASALGIAGDWLRGGRVEGAWLSADQLSTHLLQ